MKSFTTRVCVCVCVFIFTFSKIDFLFFIFFVILQKLAAFYIKKNMADYSFIGSEPQNVLFLKTTVRT